MHFLCSTFGSSGDVFPMLGLALELRNRGHRVTFATNPYYTGLAAKYGMPFEALGTREQFDECIAHPDLWHPRRSIRHIFRTLQLALRRQYEVHVEAAAAGDTVGVTSLFGFGALMAQDADKLRVLTVHCQPAVLWSDIEPPTFPGMFGPRWLKSLQYRIGERFFIDPLVCPMLNAWRRELGLPPVRKITRWWHSPSGVVGMFPDWFAAPQRDWPANFVQTNFPLWNDRDAPGLPAEVDDFLNRGSPPIVFTPGSTNIHGRQFFSVAIAACRTLGRRAIFLTEFPDQLPQPLPAGVAHFRYVPLDALLPRCAAVVHHGGVGSTSQGMAAGIPTLVMPLAHDQFDNAARLKRLSLGDWLGVSAFRPQRVASKLNRLLNSRGIAAACRRAAGRLAERSGLAQTAKAVERLSRVGA